ncbi:MAG: AAA family ATPase [Clostridium sp.]|nr:AAA family ATPase [Clostridium sp.]
MKQINETNKSIKKDIIVENLMISNGVYLLVSHPKVGKSMFVQQLAFSLTTGEDFLGFKVNPSHVLYITTEGDINQLNDRFKLMKLKPNVNKLHIIDIDDIPDFYIRDIERDIHELTFNKEPLFIIMDMFKDIKFDTSYDLNNYQEINDVVFRKLKELCRKYNSTLLVTHHLNKRDETMGSVGLNADVSGIMKLKESKNNYNKLTLDYKGRDLGRLELNLKRNENQTFSVIDENTNDETDYNLLLFIKYAVARKDFDYTISDILSKTNILLTPTQLGGLIQRNLQLLEKEGLHITSKRTANERLWHCSYEEPSENNE